MHKCKHERYILSLLIERTLFIYNIVLSNSSNITKKYKKKCIRLLVDVQKYFINVKYQHFDPKNIKYQFDQYRILMNRFDYLLKLFDDIVDGSEKIKQSIFKNFCNYITKTVDLIFPNPNYDENYISNFIRYFINISDIDCIIDHNSNDTIYHNKFYLL